MTHKQSTKYTPEQIEDAHKMIRHKACLSIPDNHEYKYFSENAWNIAYECIHCRELLVKPKSYEN